MESKQIFNCECGKHRIELSFKDNMPVEVVDRAYCPDCTKNGDGLKKSWPISGNWALHFNLEVAKMFMMARLQIDPELVNPGFIIDQGYVE